MSDEDSELKLRSFEIHQPAPKALQEILNALQSAGTEVFYAIRSRVKSVKAIQEKTHRKRNDGKPDYKPDDITDIVGIRIVTLFREDIISALKIFLGMIRHQVPNSPFVKDELKEGLIYTNATAGDPEAITSRLRSVFESFDFSIKDSNIMQMKTAIPRSIWWRSAA